MVARTAVIGDDAMDAVLGCRALFKCEHQQPSGAFKLRGASNAVARLREQGITSDVATHSSGNHGAALALAARNDGRTAHVVMPENAVPRKVEAVKTFGGRVIFCEATQAAREQGLAALVDQGLVAIPPYDHHDIICGQGTAALEFLEQAPELDVLVTPVGGGGLVSGSAIVAASADRPIRVIAAEPAGAADTHASIERGSRVDQWKPDTIADGLRALVGTLTFPIIRELVHEVLTVSEKAILEGIRLTHAHLGELIEPSSSVVIGAALEHPQHFSGLTVGMIISGGNIDPALASRLELRDA
ncbi:MAG: pyridoxal-phosphate dependent enzyme [Xanthomonadales bacterium]|nr:pyridoxal-phosphate dependent enzyme [Xanthomonadales bacterium]